MRYYIDFDKLVNQFVPHYLGGRKLILYLQSVLFPLRSLNDTFVEWAKETRIEAAMTSQIFPFEWYLNRVFSGYFADSTARISIKNGVRLGVPIYSEDADVDQFENMVLYEESEGTSGSEPLYYYNEKTDDSQYSFSVYAPAPNNAIISDEAYVAMLTVYINKYRLAGKTFIIKIA